METPEQLLATRPHAILFECIAGFNRPRAGTVRFDGVDITRARPEERARRGLIRSFQNPRLFESLTVHQTVLVAHEREAPSRLLHNLVSLPATRRSERDKARAADDLIRTMGLDPYADKLVSELSTGTRRITELACVLALQPTLLLLDEPSSGIAQREAEALGPLLRRVRDELGASLLVIEHDLPLLTSISDRMIALDLGRVVVDGSPREVIEHPTVVASYLGTNEAAISRSDAPAPT